MTKRNRKYPFSIVRLICHLPNIQLKVRAYIFSQIIVLNVSEYLDNPWIWNAQYHEPDCHGNVWVPSN